MKVCNFMLLDLTRCLSRYIFCSQKAYAANLCLIISKSTLLKLSTVHIPISMETWLKVALVSPVKSYLEKVYPWGHWEVYPLFMWSSYIVGEVALIRSLVIITRGIMTLNCYVLSFLLHLLEVVFWGTWLGWLMES